MTYPPSHTGAAWTTGLPPGVYENRPQVVRPRLVQMDVAGFVGLTERGPVATPVAVESWDQFRRHFGEAGGGRLLPQSVYQFFANAGRRCVVVRAVDYVNAETATWQLPGVRTAADGPVHLRARDPGAWGRRLRMMLGFKLAPAGLSTGRLGETFHINWVSPSPKYVEARAVDRVIWGRRDSDCL